MTDLVARLAKLDPAQRAALLARRNAAKAGTPLTARGGDPAVSPLGLDQERLWILDQLDPGSVTYTLGFGLRFLGAFDLDVFLAAAEAVVRRHDLLRSGVEVHDGRPFLQRHDDRGADVTFVDLSADGDDDREQRRAEFIAAQVKRPFDLRHDPVLRLGIIRLAPDDHQVVETMPHSFTDQWSYIRLNRELLEHYRAFAMGEQPKAPALPVQFGDFAQWQREHIAGPHGARHRAFWRSYLEGVPDRLELPYDFSADTSDRSGKQYNFILDREVTAGFRARAGAENVTVATAMTAAYVAMLHEETGSHDLVVGVPSVTRGEPATADLIGFLLTNLPIRVRLPENPTPLDVLRATAAATTAIAEHKEIPFGEIVEAALPSRSANRYPLLQTMLVQISLDDASFVEVPGARVYANAVPEGVSSMDMTTAWWQVGDVMYGRIEYRTALFRPATISRMAHRLLQLVEAFAFTPDVALQVRAQPVAATAPSLLAGASTVGVEPAQGAGAEQVAAAWSEVLGVPAHPDDTFFEVGGTSILAVRLNHLLRSAGFACTLRDIFSHPTLGLLTAALESRGVTAQASPTADSELGVLSPEQELLLASGLRRVERFAHSFVLSAGEELDRQQLVRAFAAVVAAHPVLTAGFPDRSRARLGNHLQMKIEAETADPDQVIEAHLAGFDVEDGPLFAVSLLPGDPDLVVITAHHLVIDGMSWGIVLGDLERAYRGETITREAQGYLEHAAALRRIDPAPQESYWREQIAAIRPFTWRRDGQHHHGGEQWLKMSVPIPHGCVMSEELGFTAVARALRAYTEQVVVAAFGLGRDPVPGVPQWDPATSVGYYSCAYPLLLPTTGADGDLEAVATALRAVPDGGKGFNLVHRADQTMVMPRVIVNYTGGLIEAVSTSLFAVQREVAADGDEQTERDVDIAIGVREREVVFRWLWRPDAVDADDIRHAAATACDEMTKLWHPTGGGRVPGLLDVSEVEMDRLFAELTEQQRRASR